MTATDISLTDLKQCTNKKQVGRGTDREILIIMFTVTGLNVTRCPPSRKVLT